MKTIAITLDGVPVSGRPGMTILELAQELKLRIPTLCHDPCLKPVGACRLCVVEDEASGRLLASCVTPIASGMRIRTASPSVMEARRVIVRLMLANHPESCIVCDKGNRCQLRQLAADLGIGRLDYDRIPSYSGVQDANPFIVRDLSKCILCAKCVRADQELVVVGALDYVNRGFDARPATVMDAPLERSECTFCGTCVSLCPTGALMERELPHRGTAGRRVATVCSYCGCGCALWIHVADTSVARVTPGPAGSVNGATLCVRGHYGGDYLGHPERLTSPLIRRDGRLEPASWDEALDAVADGLREIARRDGPAAVGLFGSTQCTNEENYLFQKLGRKALGTPHIDNGARFSGIASVLGLGSVLGVGASTNPLEDLQGAQVILVVGAQPAESHPVASYRIKQAVRHRGAQLIWAGPLAESMSAMARIWLRHRPGAELSLILGLMRVLVLEGLWRPDLLGGQSQAVEWLQRALARLDPSALEAHTGVDGATLREAARLLSSTRRCALVFGAGVSRSADALETIRSVARMALLLGCLGVAGGGVYPLDRGANTQGACDMGTVPEWLPGYAAVGNPEARESLGKLWGQAPPAGPGWSLCEMLEAARRSRLRALYVLGENPAALLPRQGREALAGLEFLVVQDLFLTETAAQAHVVLPGAGFAEKDGTYTNLERRVQRIRAAVKPPGDARPDSWILAELLRRMGETAEFEAVSDVMREIAAAVPQYRGIQYSRLEGGGLFWPCGDERSQGEGILYRGGIPGSGLDRSGAISATTIPEADPDHPWLAVAGETHFHFGGGTRSRRSARLRGAFPAPRARLHPQDMAGASLDAGDLARLISPHGSMSCTVTGDAGVPRGVVWVVQGPEGGGMAALMPWRWDPVTKMPQLHCVRVRLEKIPAQAAG